MGNRTRRFQNPRKLHGYLKNPSIDAVLICSPSNTHAEISMEAARHGKHIFCEKPIDHDVERIKRTIEVVQNARREISGRLQPQI